MLYYNNDLYNEKETGRIKISIDGEMDGFHVYNMVSYITKYSDFNNIIDIEKEYKNISKVIRKFDNIIITFELQQKNKTLDAIRYINKWEGWERSYYSTDQNGFYEWKQLKNHDIKKQLNKLYDKLMHIHNETMIELLKEKTA